MVTKQPTLFLLFILISTEIRTDWKDFLPNNPEQEKEIKELKKQYYGCLDQEVRWIEQIGKLQKELKEKEQHLNAKIVNLINSQMSLGATCDEKDKTIQAQKVKIEEFEKKIQAQSSSLNTILGRMAFAVVIASVAGYIGYGIGAKNK